MLFCSKETQCFIWIQNKSGLISQAYHFYEFCPYPLHTTPPKKTYLAFSTSSIKLRQLSDLCCAVGNVNIPSRIYSWISLDFLQSLLHGLQSKGSRGLVETIPCASKSNLICKSLIWEAAFAILCACVKEFFFCSCLFS
uniref:Uncharacterized protein n=1 Tax=Micrurus spixii TaxID=129469 RepID=A0A2D4MWK2_9SAUR